LRRSQNVSLRRTGQFEPGAKFALFHLAFHSVLWSGTIVDSDISQHSLCFRSFPSKLIEAVPVLSVYVDLEAIGVGWKREDQAMLE
jgi:hypothetical protein